MAKLGQYTYPDIRFGDAVEISGRVLTKFKGTVSVKGLAWELGMAEGSGTLFAKVAAMRDFGLIEGRGNCVSRSWLSASCTPQQRRKGRRRVQRHFNVWTCSGSSTDDLRGKCLTT